MNNKDLINKIEKIESQLRELRLEIANENKPEKKNKGKKKIGTLLKGDKVLILNPTKGQERKGVVAKINSLTGYATVETINAKNHRERIVRKLKNLKKIRDE
jgi:hypothetical protein